MNSTKRITVITTSVIRTGTSSSGKAWTLYDVTAVDEAGAPIEQKLKSFDNLTGTVDVEVERTEHEKYGVSFMLKLPRGAGGGGGGGGGDAQPSSAGSRLGPKVDELRVRVDELERQNAALSAAVTQLVEAVAPLLDGRPVPEVPPPTSSRPRPTAATF